MDGAPHRSGMAKAGEILLLVGGILRLVGAGFLILFGTVFASVIAAASQSSSSSRPPPGWLGGFLGALYIGLGLLCAVSGILGLVGWKRAKANNWGSAFVFGLVGSLLPPVDILLLLGAIFCKVSPEGQAHPPQAPSMGSPPAWQPPQTR